MMIVSSAASSPFYSSINSFLISSIIPSIYYPLLLIDDRVIRTKIPPKREVPPFDECFGTFEGPSESEQAEEDVELIALATDGRRLNRRDEFPVESGVVMSACRAR